MQDINLLPRELQREGFEIKKIALVVLVFVFLLGTCAYYSYMQYKHQALQRELALLEEELNLIQPGLDQLNRHAEFIKLSREKVSFLENLKARRVEINPVLTGITGATPAGIQLTGLFVEHREQKAYQGGFASPGSRPVIPGVEEKTPVSGNNDLASNDEKSLTELREGTRGREDILPSPPNSLVVNGSTRKPEMIGIFIDQLAKLPYFDGVYLLKMHATGDGTHLFTIEARLREVRQAEQQKTGP